MAEEPSAESVGVHIPRVLDRPLRDEDPPFMKVVEFKLRGVEDMPRYGILLKDVEAILSTALASQPERGYSIGELQNVAKLLTTYYRQKGVILAVATVPVQTVADGVVDLEMSVGMIGPSVGGRQRELHRSSVAQAF